MQPGICPACDEVWADTDKPLTNRCFSCEQTIYLTAIIALTWTCPRCKVPWYETK